MIVPISEKEFVNKLFLLIGEVEIGKQFDSNNISHVTWLKKQITNLYLRGAHVFAYYINRNNPIGFVIIIINDGPKGVSYLGKYAEIVDIGVIPEYRKKGYGSKLLKYAESISKDSGIYCLGIYTTEFDHDAINFYKRNGFGLLVTIPDVHGPNAPGKVWMRKILENLKAPNPR